MDQNTKPGPDDILVVDDDLGIIDLVTDLLMDEGYRVRSARDGLEAWQAIESAPPALLVTDIRMPCMTGRELITRLRASSYDFPILVVAATQALAEPLLEFAPIEYIAKPFELELFLDGVRRYVVPSHDYANVA